MTLLEVIETVFQGAEGPLHVQDLYAKLPDRLPHSIRSQIYRNLGRRFQRVGRGLYVATEGEAACVVVEGDALEELKRLPSGFADALVTDPPYPWMKQNLDIHTTTRLRMRWGFEKKEIDRELGLEIYRVLKEGAHAFFFVPAETAATRSHIEGFIRLLEGCGFVFNKRFIWDRQRLGMGYNGRCRYEGILFMSRGRRRMPCDLKIPDVLAYKTVDRRVRRHPCEKPQGLLEAILRFATEVGEVVLDCFAGSLSTGRAALELGRRAFLVEKDAELLAKGLGEVVV